MRDLSALECEQISGGGWWARAIAIYDAATDAVEGFWEGAKDGFGLEEEEA